MLLLTIVKNDTSITELDFAFDNHLEFLSKVKYKKLILLSATINWEQLRKLKSTLNPFIFKITLYQAVRFGILPEPTIYVKKVKLTTNKYQLYKNFITTEIKANETFDEKIEKLKEDLTKQLNNTIENTLKTKEEDYLKELRKIYGNISSYTEQDKEQLLKESTEKANKIVYNDSNYSFLQLKLIGNKRKKFLEDIKMREFVNGNYFNRLKDKRTIFFLPTVEACQNLGNSISYKSGNKTNEKLLTQFNESTINYLTAKKILDRGMNCEDIEYGVVLSFDFGGNTLLQKFGRIIRGVAPKIIMFIVENSKEEKVFDKIMKSYGGKIQYI